MAQRYFEAPAIRIAKGCANLIRENVEEELRNDGWALNVRLDSDCMIKIFFMKADLMFRLQTGNNICAPYDLLKLEFHHKPERTEAAALAFPIQDAAEKIGDKNFLFREDYSRVENLSQCYHRSPIGRYHCVNKE